MNWFVQQKTGRLVEGRIFQLRAREDAVAYADAFRAHVLDGRKGLSRAIVCADYRRAPLFSPEVTDVLKRLMLDLNGHVLRSAILVDESSVLRALQVGRVARESNNPDRRRFGIAAELAAWLAEVTTTDEQRRLLAFLDEGAKVPAATARAG